MRRFTALIRELDETNKTLPKVAAIARYFKVPLLTAWAIAEARIPEWLFRESYDAVGDLAEVISLVLPDRAASDDRPLWFWSEALLDLRLADPLSQQGQVLRAWTELGTDERFVWNKLLLGNFRLGVSQQLVLRGLAKATGVDLSLLAERIAGAWTPSEDSFLHLIDPSARAGPSTQPYPFCLAHALDMPLEQLGPITDWQIEWKWDGIRAQIVKREGALAIWSRGGDLITERFPEFDWLARHLPDGTVLDGEILAWRGGRPLPFAELQKRIGRKNLTRAMLRNTPVRFLAYDLLEHAGNDVRLAPLQTRRQLLDTTVYPPVTLEAPASLGLSPLVNVSTWTDLIPRRDTSRARGAEGFMLKRLDSSYQVGRVKGNWWKWKVDPLTVDAVLTAAQRGSGKRAGLYTDYTFSVWKDGALVPFAKAYSGLTDAEIAEVDAFIRAHMKEKFGPVRTVEPQLVFELGFESIQYSTRHKSGVAVRFPRILRWRRDKKAVDADSLATISALIDADRIEAQRKTGNTMREGLLFDL